MTANIVCSDTYIDAFSKLDKKTQKKSLETIRLMQRSLRSDSLKIEKLNTNLDFKSARVTQDFRVIFTQSGNTILLVYIDHHDNAYQWASRRLRGFDATGAKPAYEYYEQSKKEFESITEETVVISNDKQSAKKTKTKSNKTKTRSPFHVSDKPPYTQSNHTSQPHRSRFVSIFSNLLFLLAGIIIGIIIMYFL